MSAQKLTGKTIARVEQSSIDVLSLTMTDGSKFNFEADWILPIVGMYGIVIEEAVEEEKEND